MQTSQNIRPHEPEMTNKNRKNCDFQRQNKNIKKYRNWIKCCEKQGDYVEMQ